MRNSSSVPPTASNSPIWPAMTPLFIPATVCTALSAAAAIRLRGCPKPSIAPQLTSDSSIRTLPRPCVRSRKSSKPV